MAETIDLLVNGRLISYGHHRLTFFGDLVDGIQSISWGHSRKRPKGYGADPAKGERGRGKGKYEVDVLKIKGHTDTIGKLQVRFAQEAGKADITDVKCPIVLQYDTNDDDGNGGDEFVYSFRDCQWETDSGTAEDGDPLQEEVELSPTRISKTINGVKVTLYDSTGEV